MSLDRIEQALASCVKTGKLKIPPYPAVASKLAELARRRHGASLVEMTTIVSADAALAAQVLGRARSAANHGAEVTTLFGALSRIGLEQLVELALATGLGVAVTAPGPLAELRRDTWRRSLLAAQLARMLAENRNIAPETAYSAALVHDLGATIVISALENIAQREALPVLQEGVWRTLVARHRVQVGMVMAARWNLPAALVDAIAHAHEELPESPLARLINLGDRIVAKLDGMPTTGLAAMMDFDELSDIERCSIGSVVQEVVKHMANYTVATAPTSPVVVTPTSAEPTFPVSFDVQLPDRALVPAASISMDGLELESSAPLPRNWLATFVLCLPEPIALLANVRSCEKRGARYAIVVQPFALDAVTTQRWLELVDEARSRDAPALDLFAM